MTTKCAKKKKISILSLHLGYGGIEQSIVTVANILCNYYDVELAVCYKLYDVPAFPLDNRVKICYLNSDLKPNRQSFLDAFHEKRVLKIFKEGFYSIKVLYYRKRNMVKYIQRTNADIIISTRDIFNFLVSKYACGKVLKIGWEHNHFHGNIRYATRIFNSAKKLDYLVLVSKELQKYYANKLSGHKCRAVYIPNAIDALPPKVASLKNKRLICVGRLSPEKGHLDLLKVYAEIHKKRSDWSLDIVGDGSEKERLNEYIEKHNLQKSVFLHGFQGKDVVNKLLAASSIYLMTSYTESFGIVLIEAMSYGIPCVAYDSAEGAREIIDDKVTGFLIKNRNQKDMVKVINDLMDDACLRTKIGKQARGRVKKYTKETVGKQWVSLIEEGSRCE